MRKILIVLLLTSLLLPVFGQWGNGSIFSLNLDLYFKVFDSPSLINNRLIMSDESVNGWCCKDRRVIVSTSEECKNRGGKFFRNRKEAENFCAGEEFKPPGEPENGWCCKDGEVMSINSEECGHRRGKFFKNRKKAEEFCRGKEDKPPEEQIPPDEKLPIDEQKEVWCCKNGEIFPVFPSECRERGGRYFNTYKEAEEFCLRKIRELEKEEQPKEVIKEILCCRNGEIFYSDPEDCRKQGGRIFHSMKEAEDFCFEKRQLPRVSDSIVIKAVSGKTLEKTRKKNLFTPILVKLIHRYLEDREDINELDRLFRDELNKVGGISREILEKIVRVYNNQSDSERSSRFEPIAPDKSDLAPITIEDVRKSFKKIYPSYFKIPDKLYEISGGVPSPPDAKKKAGPYINYITPMGAKPGETIYIYGKHFQKKGNLVLMKSINISPEWSKIIYYPKVANAQHRLEMVIPKNAPTCKYEFQVTTIFGSSNKVFYSMSGHKYKVIFNEMHCIDETNPEALESDEIVTFWVIIADKKVINKSSRTYTGFNDGTKWSYTSPDDLVLDWTEIKSGLSIATELWEWDEGDIQSAKVIGVVAAGVTVGIAYLAGYLSVYGGIVAGIVLAILYDNFDWIAKNIFGMDNERMGQIIMSWSQEQLAKMLSPQSPVGYTMNFKDHGGEYNIYATISVKK